jgi:hypothetical protein
MMNIYVLNGRKYFDASAFISNLSELISNNKAFDISYPISDKNLQERLAVLFQKYNVRAFLEQKNDEEIEAMETRGAQYGYLVGIISGYFITSSETFEYIASEISNTLTEGVISATSEMVSEGAAQVLGDSLSKFEPITGAIVKVILSIAFAKTGKEIGKSLTKKYLVRSNLSTNNKAHEIIELRFSPAK